MNLLLNTFFNRSIQVITLISLTFNLTYGQRNDSTSIYKVNPYISGALGIGGVILSQQMLGVLADAEPISDEVIQSLDKSNVNRFDRIALEQENYSYAGEAHRISDYFLTGAVLLPATLMFDRKIRRHWLDVTLMYFETQALSANAYVWLGPMLKERYRPVTYYQEEFEGDKEKTDQLYLGRNRHSWFSGHVTNTAAGTFFFAKVLTDFHPEWNGKWKIWAAAALPPALVGYYRYRALKHFPTDIIVGYLVGAGSGILVPHLHKKKDKNLKMSFYYNPESIGLNAKLVIK